MHSFSPTRARLASFEHAYAVAIRLRLATGLDQFVVVTGNPLQPVRVTTQPPGEPLNILARIV